MESSDARDIPSTPTASLGTGSTSTNGHASGAVKNGESNSTPGAVSRGAKWRGKSARAQVPADSILLKNLDFKVTHESLAKVVRHVMPDDRQFVEIELVEDRTTGSFRGMAFVTFANIEDATLAIEELSKVVINGRKVFPEFRRIRATDRDIKHSKKADVGNNHSHQSQNLLTADSPNGASSSGANSSGNSTRALDIRSQFFANRGNERRHETNHFDRARESDFRELLAKFAKGWINDTSVGNDACSDQSAENVPPGESSISGVAGGESRGERCQKGAGNEEGEAKTLTEQVKKAPNDMVFDATLTSYERRMVHILCEELKLGHISRFDEDGNRVLHVTRDRVRAAEWAREEAENPARSGGGTEFGRRRHDRQEGGRRVDTERERPRLNYYCPRQMAADGSGGYTQGGGGIKVPSYLTYTPKRQPSGPDGSVGFAARRKYHRVTVADKEKESSFKDGKDSKSKGKSKNGGRGRKASSSSLNPHVPPFSPNGGS